ncbi:MAG: DUF1287 domain-containing protein [Alphaproteobacteria bacterium]|nr:DUF1287 domain-containing protein [Alphaproteobacteria bacterium]
MPTRRTVLLGIAALPLAARAVASAAVPDPVVAAARAQIGVTLYYAPAYERIAYPMGDVPRERGVCTDVVIRAYRDALGLDLQELIHRDMQANFSHYPNTWGANGTDSNIDHRRVGNQRAFLTRQGAVLPHEDRADFAPGDLLTMRVGNGLPHVAIVSQAAGENPFGPRIVHNIGRGAREEAIPAGADLTARFRWAG